MSIKALEAHLAPLTPFLKMDGVTEICINRPKEVFIEHGKFQRHDVPGLELGLLETLAALIAEFNHKEFPAPLLSGSLPTGERIQFVLSPACENGKLVCSIRRHQMKDLSLENYEEKGTFDGIKSKGNYVSPHRKLREQYYSKDYLHFIGLAIQAKKNILISGGTGTGKTTFLNACLKAIPKHERLITVEDTREVVVNHANAAHLLFNEEEQKTTSLNIFKACLRLRPDRIFLSELRGKEVWPYLRAANSGHPGSLSTIHADSPEGAFTQLVFMMQQAGTTSTEEQIRKYLKSIIHIVVQLERDPTPERFVTVSEVYFGDA